MDERHLIELFEALSRGDIDPRSALAAAQARLLDEAAQHRVDRSRRDRNGFPEVIYAEGKPVGTLVEIAAEILGDGTPLLATRCSTEQAAALLEVQPELEHHETARIVRSRPIRREQAGSVGILAAGTTDLPVAEEAALTVESLGHEALRLFDVGVAGIHRVLGHRERLDGFDAIIVAAGMEGALPSVVGGLVETPVIAVPTSVGYGAAFGGVAALLGMLNSCAPGVVVVNIDNGFGAGFAAGRILARSTGSSPGLADPEADR